MAALKRVWQENLSLTPAQQMQVALLMSDAQVARGEFSEARGWLYRALSTQSQYAPVVARLKKLDSLMAAAAQAAQPAPPETIPGTPSAPPAAPGSDKQRPKQPGAEVGD